MGYRFGATYVGDKHTGPGEAFPVLLGDVDAGYVIFIYSK